MLALENLVKVEAAVEASDALQRTKCPGKVAQQDLAQPGALRAIVKGVALYRDRGDGGEGFSQGFKQKHNYE
jgi:hypothetical protein